MSDSPPSPNPHLLTPNCVGWLLEDMREAVERHNSACKYPVRIIETAPPQRPQRRERPVVMPNDKRPPEVHYGAWRILRCQYVGEEAQLIVAREQVLPST